MPWGWALVRQRAVGRGQRGSAVCPEVPKLLVEPPWTPPVLWDRVTLTCQGSGTAAATTWYKDGQRWRLQGPDRLRVTESGTYQCDRPGTGLSPPVSVFNGEGAWLVLQVPARALLEGDTVTLRCRSWQNNPATWVSFYREEKQLQLFRDGTELSLSPLRLHHSGRYCCRGSVDSEVSRGWKESAPVTVTVGLGVPTVSPSPFPCSCQEAPGQVSGGAPAVTPLSPFPRHTLRPPLIPAGPPRRRGSCWSPTAWAASGRG
uniref:Uncharacterized protein n=1 Tax=Corvus moneduloides TaxID=1196302 RepID=A0A8U7NV80_CORMO